MLIINPIYDQAFKYMMDNEDIAKKVISIILDKEVKSIQPRPQEIVTYDNKRNIPLSRFDFKAVIRSDENEYINVLIEIQKSKSPDPIMRFRRYLGKNYIRRETIIDENGDEKEVILPLLTIYFLGYNLPEYDTPALRVNNQVIDVTSKKEIFYKNDFVQLLTHPSYILQLNRLRADRKTKLEKFLSIFDQSQKTDKKYLLDLEEEEIVDEDLFEIRKYLRRATQDEEIILKLELEEDIEEEFVRIEKEIKVERKLKEEAEKKEQEAKKKEQEAKIKEQEVKVKLAKRMLKYDEPLSEIIEETGLTKEEIEKLVVSD